MRQWEKLLPLPHSPAHALHHYLLSATTHWGGRMRYQPSGSKRTLSSFPLTGIEIGWCSLSSWISRVTAVLSTWSTTFMRLTRYAGDGWLTVRIAWFCWGVSG